MTKGKENCYLIAKYDYTAKGPQELDLKKNERLTLLDDSKPWWKVLNSRNESGFVPSNYVKKEKQSIFDSIRKKVSRKGSAKSSCSPSPASSPVASKIIDINISESSQDRHALNELGTVGNSYPIAVAIVKYNYVAQQPDEISLSKGNVIKVLEKSSDGWWRGETNSLVGWFPSNYICEEKIGETRSTQDPNTSGEAASSMTPKAHKQESKQTTAELVTALYSFEPQNEEELSFTKGELLEVVDKPSNDPDWWMVRNRKGDTGLVPKSYVNVLRESSDDSVNRAQRKLSNLNVKDSKFSFDNYCDLSLEPWYYGVLSRGQCDEMLDRSGQDGNFLIRNSETSVSPANLFYWILTMIV